ncbi:acyl-CoA dehydrogenase family protein [Nocardia sp. NRRL S-836]|uniref:acyl-CoA dehydrogenase family protein n=1 Tax=Nocardia sp. NRRL S-836 TaxID=1519492 RepID=UPI000A7B892A|nr:acyl-CoA dehydrogenase family protein [Nocardia sp. NRRL S-836]
MLTELFDDDTIPLLRRLGERPRGGGEPADEETRRQVLAALVDSGRSPAEVLRAAELMGAALYQSPFLDTVAAAEIFPASPGRTTGLALREKGTDNPAHPAPVLVRDGRVTAVRRFVAFAPDVDDLLVVGGNVAALVAVGQPGVRIRRQDDVGRGDLYTVEIENAVAQVRDVTADYPAVLARARMRHAAYLVGAAQAALRLTAAHLRERRVFGEPLARSTALAYRLAALHAEAEAVRALIGTEPSPKTAAQAVLLAGAVARQSAEEAVHLHGARGMTEHSDAQLFYRRAAVDAQWYGTAADLRAELLTALGA